MVNAKHSRDGYCASFALPLAKEKSFAQQARMSQRIHPWSETVICACRSQPGISVHLAHSTPVASTQYLRKALHLARATATDSRCGCMPLQGAPEEESCPGPHPALAPEATTTAARSIEASRGAGRQECPQSDETRCEMYGCSKAVLQSTSCCQRRLCPECTLRCSQRRLGPAELRSFCERFIQSGVATSTSGAVADFRWRPLLSRHATLERAGGVHAGHDGSDCALVLCKRVAADRQLLCNCLGEAV